MHRSHFRSVAKKCPVVAVVDMDEGFRALACSRLQRSGMEAWGAESVENFYVRALNEQADLVTVELDMPDERGLALLNRLANYGMPVIAICERGDVETRITALDAGAKQFFSKPLDFDELVAGIRSLVRRPTTILVGSMLPMQWRVDSAKAQLIAPNQKAVSLTTGELDLMLALASTDGSILTKGELALAMDLDDANFHRVEASLSRLRRKTSDSTGLALPVRTVFGKGLVFLPDSS